MYKPSAQQWRCYLSRRKLWIPTMQCESVSGYGSNLRRNILWHAGAVSRGRAKRCEESFQERAKEFRTPTTDCPWVTEDASVIAQDDIQRNDFWAYTTVAEKRPQIFLCHGCLSWRHSKIYTIPDSNLPTTTSCLPLAYRLISCRNRSQDDSLSVKINASKCVGS